MTSAQLKAQRKQQKLQAKMAKKGKGALPASAYAHKWYAVYYNQIQPHELQSLQGWFSAMDQDKSGTITAQELVNAPWPGGVSFDPTTCYKLVRTFDNDWTGTITFYEFAALFKFVMFLHSIFQMADQNRSGTLEPMELQWALQQAGFMVDEQSVRPYLKRFQSNQVNISFASFVALATQLAHARAVFDKLDTDHDGRIILDMPTYYRIIMAHSE